MAKPLHPKASNAKPGAMLPLTALRTHQPTLLLGSCSCWTPHTMPNSTHRDREAPPPQPPHKAGISQASPRCQRRSAGAAQPAVLQPSLGGFLCCFSHSCVSILISSCHVNPKAAQMINKMESSRCHGNAKRSGQAQACAENGLIGRDTAGWGLAPGAKGQRG